MFLKRVPAGIYGANCYVLADDQTGKAAVIDPGGDAEEILSILKENELELEFIILTHAHGDHIGALDEIRSKTNVPAYIHQDDLYILQDKNKNYSAAMGGSSIEATTDYFVADGQVLKLGELELKIIHTPGHSPGGICILVENVVMTGDTLFAGSIGRSDLEGGDHGQLIDSIKKKLMPLDDDLTVLPGHGPATTIGIEKTTNPFLR